MSIVLPTAAPNAIVSYDGLVADVRDQMDDVSYSLDAINRALRKAEAHFNRSLRAPQMETTVPLAITSEVTALPLDFLELRYIFQDGSPDKPLVSMSPAAMLRSYAGMSGEPAAYAIEGRSLRIGPVGSTPLQLVYYRQIEPLTEQSPSNWLLRDHPDLYVSGVLYYLGVREGDVNRTTQMGQAVQLIIDTIKGEIARNRWGAGPLVPAGILQVRGARV